MQDAPGPGLPALLSIIAGLVDLTGFFTLGNVFTAHVTGNLVVAAAATVRGGPLNPAQLWAIPVFIAAVAFVWAIAQGSRRRGVGPLRVLLSLQLALLTAVLVVALVAEPSHAPHGWAALVAAMRAVAAMACQFALLRVALPDAPSTAVMTGNLTNAVLALLDTLSPDRRLMSDDPARLRRSLQLLAGFLVGCVVAAAAIALLGDAAWICPVALAAAALVL